MFPYKITGPLQESSFKSKLPKKPGNLCSLICLTSRWMRYGSKASYAYPRHSPHTAHRIRMPLWASSHSTLCSVCAWLIANAWHQDYRLHVPWDVPIDVRGCWFFDFRTCPEKPLWGNLSTNKPVVNPKVYSSSWFFYSDRFIARACPCRSKSVYVSELSISDTISALWSWNVVPSPPNMPVPFRLAGLVWAVINVTGSHSRFSTKSFSSSSSPRSSSGSNSPRSAWAARSVWC